MQMFVERIKGDFIYADWIKEEMDNYHLKIKELDLKEYKLMDVKMDYMNTYEYYQDNNGNTVCITVMCS